jgi:hypothetical protein
MIANDQGGPIGLALRTQLDRTARDRLTAAMETQLKILAICGSDWVGADQKERDFARIASGDALRKPTSDNSPL